MLDDRWLAANSKAIQLCAEGMQLEAIDRELARRKFASAWQYARDDFEKFIAAHFLARHQLSVKGKLRWDKSALKFARRVKDIEVTVSLPSLYLNIGRCYEEMHDFPKALRNYRSALGWTFSLPDDGYAHMIKTGIESGIRRVQEASDGLEAAT